jgi:hypothetical protein
VNVTVLAAPPVLSKYAPSHNPGEQAATDVPLVLAETLAPAPVEMLPFEIAYTPLPLRFELKVLTPLNVTPPVPVSFFKYAPSHSPVPLHEANCPLKLAVMLVSVIVPLDTTCKPVFWL